MTLQRLYARWQVARLARDHAGRQVSRLCREYPMPRSEDAVDTIAAAEMVSEVADAAAERLRERIIAVLRGLGSPAIVRGAGGLRAIEARADLARRTWDIRDEPLTVGSTVDVADDGEEEDDDEGLAVVLAGEFARPDDLAAIDAGEG